MARIGYKSSYNQDEKKLIASVLHWLSDDSQGFGTESEAEFSTQVVGGVKEQTYIPYRIDMRWKKR